AIWWIILISSACGLRLAFAATHFDFGVSAVGNILPYAAVVMAPVATLFFGLRLFSPNQIHAQPAIRLARYGRWRKINCLEARALPAFGATGLMASLLIGMLLNVPVRTVEFLTSIPALGSHAPGWFFALFHIMVADVVIMSSLYVFAFVLAIRLAPFFPRFLVLVWGMDLLAQLSIAQLVAHVPGVPQTVELALLGMLEGNLKKVLISAAIWLPYLILSDRVNVTYRQRVGA
ncbi:MAG: DUF2569 domain-containing protein, partial [Alphaproteobacteria bacterium]|nr:DUF2569 domain-containing protein [Alphaproteobacteria bacterium]